MRRDLALRDRNWKHETRNWVGAVAQLGERLVCNQEATGSIPVSSTNLMLGVKVTTESVSRFMNVAWRRTLGWKQSDPAEAGMSENSEDDI